MLRASPPQRWQLGARSYAGCCLHVRHCVRVAKEMDSKSIGLCPQGLESPRCRSSPQLALVRRRSHQAPSRMGALDRRLRSSRSPAMSAWRRSDPCGQAGARAGQGRRGGGVGMTAGRLEPAASGRGAWQLCARGPLGHHSCGARAHALSQLCKVNRRLECKVCKARMGVASRCNG